METNYHENEIMNKDYVQFTWDPNSNQLYDPNKYGFTNTVNCSDLGKNETYFWAKSNVSLADHFTLTLSLNYYDNNQIAFYPLNNNGNAIDIINGDVTFDLHNSYSFLVFTFEGDRVLTQQYYRVSNGSLTFSNCQQLVGVGSTYKEISCKITVDNGYLSFKNIKEVGIPGFLVEINNTGSGFDGNGQIAKGIILSNVGTAILPNIICTAGSLDIEAYDSIYFSNTTSLDRSIADIKAPAIDIYGKFILNNYSDASFEAQKMNQGDVLGRHSDHMVFEIHDASTVKLNSDNGCPIDFTGDNKPVQGFINFISDGYAGGSITISGMDQSRLQALQDGGFVALDGKLLDPNEFLDYVDCTQAPNVTISIKQMPSHPPLAKGPYFLPSTIPTLTSIGVFPRQGYYFPEDWLNGAKDYYDVAVLKMFDPGTTLPTIRHPVTGNNSVAVMCGNQEQSVSFNGSMDANAEVSFNGVISYSMLTNSGFSNPTPISGMPVLKGVSFGDAHYDALNTTAFFAGTLYDLRTSGMVFVLVNTEAKEYTSHTFIASEDLIRWGGGETTRFAVSNSPWRIYFQGKFALGCCDINNNFSFSTIAIPDVDGLAVSGATDLVVDNVKNILYVSAVHGWAGDGPTIPVIHRFDTQTNNYLGIVMRLPSNPEQLVIDTAGTYLYASSGNRINVISTEGGFIANSFVLADEAVAVMGWDSIYQKLVVGLNSDRSDPSAKPARVYVVTEPYKAGEATDS